MSVPLKGEFLLYIFSSIYIHLVIYDNKTTDMFNKYKYTQEHPRWIWLLVSELDEESEAQAFSWVGAVRGVGVVDIIQCLYSPDKKKSWADESAFTSTIYHLCM